MRKHYILYVIAIAMILVGCEKNQTDSLIIIPPPREEMPSRPSVRDMPIDRVDVQVDRATNEANVTILGWLPDSCTAHHETTVSPEGNTIRIKITTVRPHGVYCATEAFDYQETIALGSLDAGDYTVIVNDVETSFTIEP